MSESSTEDRSLLGWIGLFAGPLFAAGFIGAARSGWLLEADKPVLNYMAGVTGWMAIWWLSEAVPAAVTGLLPLVLFPLLSLAPLQEVAAAYGNRILFLFFGGFMIAQAMQDSGLHRRIALAVIAVVGGSGSRLVLGMILATGMISMWMSNTATTIMMLPIAISLLAHVDAQPGEGAAKRHFGAALMLGVAYAASLGGMATLIGTPTNLIFKELYVASFAGRAPDVTFGGWMLMAMPLSFAQLFTCWWLLTHVAFPVARGGIQLERSVISAQRSALGPLTNAEFRSGLIFLITACLWVLREPIQGWGWAPALGYGQTKTGTGPIDDSSIAIAMSLLCFIVPRGSLGSKPLLSWKSAEQMPWGILVLFGGGLAMAEGMKHSGLNVYLGRALGQVLEGHSPLVIVAVTALGVTLLSELTSNIACVTITLPILASIAAGVDCDPRLLMISATLAASCGFMLPVATAPNAIAFATGRITVHEMARAGLWLDIVSVGLIVGFVYLLGVPVLGITLDGLPDWAAQTSKP